MGGEARASSMSAPPLPRDGNTSPGGTPHPALRADLPLKGGGSF
jgi:hypothetical protein